MRTPQPLRDKIFGEVMPAAKKRESGILLPNGDVDKHRMKVVAIGPNVEQVKVGDVLMYDHNMSEPYEWNGKKHVFINENDFKGSVFIMD